MLAESHKVDFAFGTSRCTNNEKHCFPAEVHVQCVDHAQLECFRVESPACWMRAKKQKIDSMFETFALCKQETKPFRESARSVYGPRTARMLACKSIYMMDSVLRIVR